LWTNIILLLVGTIKKEQILGQGQSFFPLITWSKGELYHGAMAMLVRVERGMGDLSKDGEGRFREPQNRIELLCVCGGGGIVGDELSLLSSDQSRRI